MKHFCILNGEIDILEPVIIDLINSKEFQRLKGIDQAGYFHPYFNLPKENRYNHSIGCYLLLKKFNATIEEQINGLIHDISHAAFSHCADYVLASKESEKNHSYQDDIFKKYVLDSSIPRILDKYNFNIDYIIDDSNFLLQERKLPDLCADRIDYSLRTAITYKEINQKEANKIIDDLIIKNNTFVFKTLEIGKKFAENFYLLNNKYYAGMESAVMFRAVSNYLRYALEKEYISKNDLLYKTDNFVLQKVNQYLKKDDKLKKMFDIMNNKYKFENNKNGGVSTFCKSRAINPFIIIENELKRLSELTIEWKEKLNKDKFPKEYYVKFLDEIR